MSVSEGRLFAVRDQFYLRGHAGNVFHVGFGADDRRPHHSFPLQEPDWLHRGFHAWGKLKVWSLGQFLFCFLNNFDIHLYVIMYITPNLRGHFRSHSLTTLVSWSRTHGSSHLVHCFWSSSIQIFKMTQIVCIPYLVVHLPL